ncbi:ABC transporter permease subunit [Cohnella sp. CFH 77786]|uniref:carbohydrate ABC transporter permease n=1 Tax=Cohnella sp. CFH 77786 TaxID=2662265 RepID=UPI001C610A81|nr:carbohydrate ABC transporter permease [Cohnella sp. CFH 77786]MBW5444817.1 ABC transporter permease subunit [Cohnella sp. CFH 77786]
MKTRRHPGEVAFDACNAIVLALACVLILLPMAHVLASSFSSNNALIHAEVGLWPVGFHFDNYMAVFRNEMVWTSFKNTLFVVAVGTLINMVLTVLTAYPLSKSYLRGRRVVLFVIVFTLIFYAPIIPTYLVVKSLGMLNTLWALIVPLAVSAFNLLLCLTFFRSLPEELFEAARVDGMTEFRMVWHIAVPLSKPIMFTLMLFYAVQHWNNYYSALLFITKHDMRPLQLYLYTIVAQNNVSEMLSQVTEASTGMSPQGLQMATVMVATVPVLAIYPFIQKHFVKGALIGSVKE